jgi:hypothetical protein
MGGWTLASSSSKGSELYSYSHGAHRGSAETSEPRRFADRGWLYAVIHQLQFCASETKNTSIR